MVICEEILYLFRCLAVEINRNEQIQDVRNPHGQVRMRISVDGEGGRDGLEQDVGEAQCDTDSQNSSTTVLSVSWRSSSLQPSP